MEIHSSNFSLRLLSSCFVVIGHCRCCCSTFPEDDFSQFIFHLHDFSWVLISMISWMNVVEGSINVVLYSHFVDVISHGRG